MAAFKYYTNSVHIYKGSGNSTASNSGCLIEQSAKKLQLINTEKLLNF